MDNYMNVILQRLPVNLQELREMPEMELTAPENTCAMFLVSLYLYLKDKKAGTEAVNLLRGPRPMTTYDEQFLLPRRTIIRRRYLMFWRFWRICGRRMWSRAMCACT